MFVLPKGWYTINPQTKRMTINIPADTVDTNSKYYPESRTYMTEGVAGVEGPQRVDIPNTLQFEVTQFNYTPPGGSTSELVTREQDIVIIRRKTLSKDSIVTFAPGTRLTTTQLNLQFNQLKFILQELISKVRNEIILKFDENAIDGPFLGNTDLKMSNRYIKNMNSPSILDINTNTGYPFVVGNTVTSGSSFAVNIDSLHEAIYFGTLHREGVTEGDAAFTGHFSAAAQDVGQIIPTNRKIINLADGTNNTDAATFGQVKNASNISTGTLTNTVLNNIPLSKLSNVSGQGYTLPVDALANSGVTVNPSISAGSSSASNTNNMVFMTVDNKGRTTAIASRNMTVDDLPVSGVSASTYGNGSTPLVELVVDSKGRITSATERAIVAGDLLDISADNINAGTLNADRLATSGVSAGTTTIPNSITVDNKGRVTAIAGGSIPVANVSGFDTQVRTNRLDQMTTPTASVNFNSQKITNLATPTLSTDAASKGYVDGYAAPLSTFNTNVTNLIQANSVYWDSSNDRYTAQRSGINKKITGVDNPSNSNDAVNLNYLNTNALIVSGGVINAASTPITNMIMRSAGSITANDVVNYGFIENLVLTPGTTLIGSTTPQIYRDAWSSLSKTSGHLAGFDRYQRTFTDLGAVASTMVLLEADSVTKTFVPYAIAAVGGGSPTVHDGYFWLDTSGANKVLNIWLTTGTTPSGNLVTRNFGLSRLVSGALATTSSTGLVSILAGNDGGLNVSAGELSLKTATASQIGGIKLGTGLVDIGSSVVKVDLSDSTSLNSSVNAASSKAVKDTYDYAVGVNSTVNSLSSTVSSVSSTATAAQNTANAALARSGGTMTGKLTTVTPASGTASIVLPSGSAPTTPVSGDVWNNAGTLQFYNGSATKSIAFTDSSITGNAATATQWAAGRTIQLTGAVTGTSGSFNGTANLSFATSLSASAAVISLQGTANHVLVNGTSGTPTAGAITLTLPQAIHDQANVAFGSVTAKNLTLGSSNNTIISTDTNGNINLDPNGTGIVNIQSPSDVDGTLNVDGVTTLAATTITGVLSASNNITMTAADPQLQIGDTSSSTRVVIDRRTTLESGVAIAGDLEFRMNTGTKAFLIPGLATTTTANHEIITRGALNTTLNNYVTSANALTLAGGLNSGAAQALGTSTAHNTTIATNNIVRVTVGSAGGVTVNSGNLTVTDGNITIGGTAGKVTAAASTVSGDGAKTLTTKDYVDNAVSNITGVGLVKAKVHFNASTPTIIASTNITSLARVSSTYTLTFTTPFSNNNYHTIGTFNGVGGAYGIPILKIVKQEVGYVEFQIVRGDNNFAVPSLCWITVIQ
jgi:hypothetical protein